MGITNYSRQKKVLFPTPKRKLKQRRKRQNTKYKVYMRRLASEVCKKSRKQFEYRNRRTEKQGAKHQTN